MKLLKYVMTADCGLAPNPYFEVCSLAVCTPNHQNARLERGDWIVGHATRRHDNKLIHAMRVTDVLDMQAYFEKFPKKRPDPFGTREQQCGDNIYYRERGEWARLPSACHNCVPKFRQDQGRRVYLSEGSNNYWYFGGSENPFATQFPIEFPDLVRDRQGCKYVRDLSEIHRFAKWLENSHSSGLIGKPRDQLPPRPQQFLVAISPQERWIPAEDLDGMDADSVGGPQLPASMGTVLKYGCSVPRNAKATVVTARAGELQEVTGTRQKLSGCEK